MEEILRAGSCIAGRQLSAGAVKRILVILMVLILAGEPAFREMAEGFLNAPLIPTAKTESAAVIDNKTEEMTRKPEKAAAAEDDDLDFRNPVFENEAGPDLVLAETAVPDPALELPRVSEETENYLTETILVENIPSVSIKPEVTIPKPDFAAAEKLTDDTLTSEVIVPNPDFTEIKKPTEGIVNTEVTVPNPDLTFTDKTADDIANIETVVPTPNPAVTDKSTEDMVNTETVIPTPAPIVPDKSTGDVANTETVIPTPAPVVPDKSTGDIANTETTVPVPDVTVTEKTTDDTVNTEVTTPAEEDSAGENVIESDPSGSDPAILDTPSDHTTTPEPIVPDTETDGSDVTGDVPSDVVEDNGGTEEAISCFLLDEAGMLYGFLPEYADMPEGCLTLPEECTGIRSGAFAGCGAEILELYIPAGAATIEEGALAGLDYLEWIEVDGGNPGCVSDSGVLFDSTMSVLLAFPSAWMDGYSVPPSVMRIAGRAFEGTSISMLDVRECGILSFGDNAFGYSAGNGIQIVVSEEGLAVYGEILAGYAVTLTR